MHTAKENGIEFVKMKLESVCHVTKGTIKISVPKIPADVMRKFGYITVVWHITIGKTSGHTAGHLTAFPSLSFLVSFPVTNNVCHGSVLTMKSRIFVSFK